MAKKILLADDSLTIQKVVELTFSDSEYDLLCVPNGQRALEKVAEEPPDLILADVVMPEKNGYEVCEAIKANPATARIPVVLLSGTFEPFDRERAERLGCDAIVSKPFDSQQLLRQVEALLTRDPREVTSNATMAIPTMTNPMPMPVPAAPPPPAEQPPAAEAGFSAADFTGSIRRPQAVAGGPDMFEEEYGQADVESAILAFEKAHPEFSYASESAVSAAMTPEPAPEPEEAADDEPSDSRRGLAGWLSEEPEHPPVAPPPQPAPAPFWVPREPEPELQPIPFASDDSASRHAPPPSMRADEGPTQQIPLAAEYAAFGRPSAAPDRITDKTPPVSEIGERTESVKAPAGEPYPTPPIAVEPPAEASVSREIEVLAQTTSIGQLKEMLSSVSRGEGGLTDDEIDRLASRVVERLSEKIVREIAWEVIPDVAELVIKQRIKELESNVE